MRLQVLGPLLGGCPVPPSSSFVRIALWAEGRWVAGSLCTALVWALVWAAACRRAQIDLCTEVEETGVVLDTDPIRLRQVLDALRPRGPRVRARLAHRAGDPSYDGRGAGGGAGDSGPGLTEQDPEVALGPGVLNCRCEGGGHGRLATVHRVVSRLEGEVREDTSGAGGAAFAIDLPALRADVS